MLQCQIDVLQQAVELLEPMTNEEFCDVIRPHLSGSIGQHLRHVIDHYLALEQGFASGVVDYNQRNREANIEVSVGAARDTIAAIQKWLATLTEADLAKPVEVHSEVSISQTMSVDCSSTLAREIVFASSHAIHHFSLIGIIRSLQGASVPEFFGYAPATITYLSGRDE
ncbi:DinB family protein [Alteromonas sp. ASW11-36]|uniref:DinB family protein n=1 Tax=Alteromonas arenosi TaxID=3055817 RepID=A0ABT7SS37_9ALTE|nr:DinB family protein [Alteromonas sp. ASW11-36]MDM7859006.1 DinB family protein [Alteromonas sp. ASW11-36]